MDVFERGLLAVVIAWLALAVVAFATASVGDASPRPADDPCPRCESHYFRRIIRVERHFWQPPPGAAGGVPIGGWNVVRCGWCGCEWRERTE